MWNALYSTKTGNEMYKPAWELVERNLKHVNFQRLRKEVYGVT